MPITVQYTSFNGQSYELDAWLGEDVALLIPLHAEVDGSVMSQLLGAVDAGYDYYARITGREPWMNLNVEGRTSIAVVDETCGAGCGYLGATGIEFLPDFFGSNLEGDFPWVDGIYDAMAARGEVSGILFYELGRNFWFYGGQLGDWGFTTGYAVINRYYAMEATGRSIAAADAEYHNLDLPDIARTYFATASANGLNTLGANTGIVNTTGYDGSADLAAALFRLLGEHGGQSDYGGFWHAIGLAPFTNTAAGAFENFSTAAETATGLDFSFLFKDSWNFEVGTSTADVVTAAAHSGSRYAILGFAGNDTLAGSDGAESLFGDVGDDQISGGEGDDQLAGGSGDDILDGGGGNDVLHGGDGTDTMRGGAGDDIYSVNVAGDVTAELSSGGSLDLVRSSVSWTLGVNLEMLVLTGSAAINGAGNALNNIIHGTIAANILNGGAGADVLAGASGNDTYVVDNAGDMVSEEVGQGIDTVRTGVSFTLGAHVDNMLLTGPGSISGTGNSLANTIIGNSANNFIDGAGGADSMRGGAGNDTYVVDNGEDVVVEAAGAGIDTVRSYVTYRIGSTVENLVMLGTAAVGTGNDLDNTILGSDSNNFINGDSGADSMRGGGGNDTYVVDDTGDVVIEFSGAGTDTVRSYFDYRIGSNVENMVLLGTAVVGTGNSASNIIIGTEGTNFLNGDGGADSLRGGAGNDTYVLDHSGDSVVETFGAGTDTVRTYVDHSLQANVENMVLIGNAEIDGNGNGLNNTILGNDLSNTIWGVDGNDSLRGLGGDDTLIGGTGNDSLLGGNGGDDFVFDAALGATNIDTIRDFSSGEGDDIVLDQSVFAALGLGTLSASAFHAGTAAADADDRIVYDSATGRIYYDADGSGAGEQTLFATVTAGTSLSSGDLFVIT